ncbi:hypothetical protein TorRG33x02_115670, partial [Trema orientale]
RERPYLISNIWDFRPKRYEYLSSIFLLTGYCYMFLAINRH